MGTSSPRTADASTADTATRPGARWWLPMVCVPLTLFLLTRVIQLGFVVLMADDDPALTERLMAWDAGWFARIAVDGYETGYSYDDEGVLTGNGLAFFPLYPLAVRTFTWLPGVSSAAAALTVAWISGATAAVLLSQLGARLYSRRTGYALAVLFGAQPMSVVLSMGYSEALFCALAVAALLALHRDAWLVAGGFTALAALTRPTGMALAAAVLLTALWRLWRAPVSRSAWRVATGAVAGLVAAPLYLLWVGLRVGDLHAWFVIQRVGWGTRWDFGASTGRFLRDTMFSSGDWVPMSTAVIILASALLVLVGVVERTWLPLSLYGVFVLVMALGSSGYFHSRPRLLLVDLLLLVPVAVALARARRITAGLVLVGVTLLGCWYGAYMITVWPYTI